MADETRQLTTKQRRFIELYLGECRLNASEAARRAGYAKRESGQDNMANPLIRARIEELLVNEARSRGETLLLLSEDAMRTDDEILEIAERAPGQAAAASVVSGLIAARTTARGHLAKAHGLLTERKEISGPHGGPISIQSIEVVLDDVDGEV